MIQSYEPDFPYEEEKISEEAAIYEGSFGEKARQAYEAFLAGEDYCYSNSWDYRFSIKGTMAAWFLNDEQALYLYPFEEWLSYDIQSNYVFVDFDGDGEEELFYYFLGGGAGNGCYMLIKYDEEKGLVSLYQEEAGARWMISVCDNGVFILDGSGGASVHGWDYYRISPEGDREMMAEYLLDFQKDAEFICYIDPSLSYTLENPHADETNYDDRCLTEEDLKEINDMVNRFGKKYCSTILEWKTTILDTYEKNK